MLVSRPVYVVQRGPLHIALCALLVRGLANNDAAKEALMAIPNRPLAPTSSIRLLRVR
jgi:hypothetical protein